MAQPIKKQTINPLDFFSKELTALVDFIAKETAPMFGITEITPELFVYSALENVDCMLYKALNSYLNSLDLTNLHDEIGHKLVRTDGVIGGKIDFSKELLQLCNEAYELRGNTLSTYITSDHILLALLKNNRTGELAKLFNSLGVNYDIMNNLSKEVHDVISNDVSKINLEEMLNMEDESIDLGNGNKATVRFIKGNPNDVMNMLQNLTGITNNKKQKPGKGIDFCTNLNTLIEADGIEDLVGREKEINTIYNVLGRKKCNNALLIGEAGVGKTQCVFGLAKQIHEGNTPLQFRNKEIWKLNAGEIFAGTQLRGMFEDRLVNLVKQLKANPNVILFIDDLDKLFGAKKSMNSDFDTGGILDEIFTNGTTQIIATTTFKNYKTIVDNNPDVADKFQQVVIEKPTIAECIEILNHNKTYYEKFHNVKYSDDIINTTVKLCNRYITEKSLPASAFDVIDEVGSYKKLNSESNDKAKKISQQIGELEKVKNTHIKRDNIADADDITLKINQFRNRLGQMQANIKSSLPQAITPNDLYHVISQHTNIPISKISASEKEELKQISDTLKQVVIGQDEVIDIISRAIKRNKIGLSDSTRTRASILSVGQTGVGKTLIAKTLAKEIYGDEKYLVRFDMSEYADETSVNKLIGASAGYVGYTEGGLLTEAIKNKKYCVLLLDEIEKAHDKVFNLFLQVLDEGFLTDNTGYKVDFRNTIIIMTSNVGAKKATNAKGIGFSTEEAQTKKDILIKELKNKFPPEFLNRIDDIVYFNPLTDENLKDIIKLELNYLRNRVENIGHRISYNDDVVDYIFNDISEEREYGARPIHRSIRNNVENKITDLLIDNTYPTGYEFKVSYDKEKGLEII